MTKGKEGNERRRKEKRMKKKGKEGNMRGAGGKKGRMEGI